MITVRHSVETILFIALLTGVMLFVMIQRNIPKNQRVFSAALPDNVASVPTEMPKEPQVSVMDSPDGIKTLTMIKQEDKEISHYVISTSSQSDNIKKEINKKDEPNSHVLTIPYNTWSPDNKYFFLKETTPSVVNYYVFTSSGDPLPSKETTVNIQDLFSQKQPDYRITDVTGWADPSLIVVNTVSSADDRKVSFWFDVPSQSFILLSTYFK